MPKKETIEWMKPETSLPDEDIQVLAVTWDREVTTALLCAGVWHDCELAAGCGFGDGSEMRRPLWWADMPEGPK